MILKWSYVLDLIKTYWKAYVTYNKRLQLLQPFTDIINNKSG